MFPNIEFMGRTISPYMICILAGLLVAGLVSILNVKKEQILDYLLMAALSLFGIMSGGSLLFGLTRIDYIIKMFTGEIDFSLYNIIVIFSGSVFYGGLFGGILVAWAYCKISKLKFSDFSDYIALFIPLFHFFGRIGCFLVGCCYGRECPFGFTYTQSLIESANGVKRFPVQLLEAFGNLIIFALVFYLFRKKLFKDRLLYLYFVCYSLLRFADEFLRGDEYRGFLWNFSTSQWISIIVFIFGIVMLKRTKGLNSE